MHTDMYVLPALYAITCVQCPLINRILNHCSFLSSLFVLNGVRTTQHTVCMRRYGCSVPFAPWSICLFSVLCICIHVSGFLPRFRRPDIIPHCCFTSSSVLLHSARLHLLMLRAADKLDPSIKSHEASQEPVGYLFSLKVAAKAKSLYLRGFRERSVCAL
jgi:hypothetical protein